ncbi:MAG TPA: hypothetical protein VHC69_00080 [Polyangiaceae bacterium]|nr:hypothetical protein [Polyangiaceae bacterium]
MIKIARACLCGSLLLACSNSNGGGGAGAGGYLNGGGLPNGGAPIGGTVGAGGAGGVGNGDGGVGNGGSAIGNGGSVVGNGGSVIGNGGTITGNGGSVTGNGGSGNGGAGAGGGAGGGTITSAMGCQGQNLAVVPDDTSARGPWVVGVQTVHVPRSSAHANENLTIEITYPAAPGSEAGKPEATYDVRDWLPKNPTQPSNYTPIADSESPAVTPIGGNLFRGLPIDATHGPYPVIIFMHGTASFRIASGTIQTLWASRGFVVVAADYPGLMLADQLCSAGCGCQPSGAADYPSDFQQQMSALMSPSGELAFLAGHLDMGHVGYAGHSVGGCTVAAQAASVGAQVVIPLSSAAPITAGGMIKSAMFISGMSDTVFNYASGSGLGNIVCPGATGAVTDAYNSTMLSGGEKRLVGVTNGGHLTPTDLCQKNSDGNNAIQVLHNHHWCGVDSVAVVGLPTLFDCGANNFDWTVGVKDVGYATTAAFEEVLTCHPERATTITNMMTAQPTIGDFKESK